MKTLTDKEAYAAMYYFLKKNWERTTSIEVSDLLSFMSLLPDGSSADPAMLKDWEKAVDFALNGGSADLLKLH